MQGDQPLSVEFNFSLSLGGGGGGGRGLNRGLALHTTLISLHTQ